MLFERHVKERARARQGIGGVDHRGEEETERARARQHSYHNVLEFTSYFHKESSTSLLFFLLPEKKG